MAFCRESSHFLHFLEPDYFYNTHFLAIHINFFSTAPNLHLSAATPNSRKFGAALTNSLFHADKIPPSAGYPVEFLGLH